MRAMGALEHGTHLRIGGLHLVAEGGGNEFAEVVIAFAVRGQIAPQIAEAGSLTSGIFCSNG